MVPGRRYNVRYIGRRVRQRWWMLLLPLVVTGSLASIVARALPNIYSSQATIVVVRQQVPETYVRSTVTVSLPDRLRTARDQILSSQSLERILNEFDLYGGLRQQLPTELLIEWLRRSINIRLTKPDTFVVGYSGYYPERVAKVTEYLATSIIRESMKEREMLADGTSQFLESELRQTRDRLAEHERRVEAFRRKYAGQLPTQLEANLRVLQSTDVQLQAVVETLNRDRDRREEVARELAAASVVAAEQGVRDNGADQADTGGGELDPTALPSGPPSARLKAARTTLAKLQLRLTPEHPDVRRLQHVVAELEKQEAPGPDGTGSVSESRIAVLQQTLAKIDDQIAARQATEKRLRDAIALYQSRVEAVPQREAEWTELTRDYNTLQGVYTGLLAKREESRIAASLERKQVGEQFKVVEHARVPRLPSSPNRPFIALIGFGIGLGTGLVLLVFREVRDRGLRSEEEVVAALALPVVGMVPLIVTAVDRRRMWRRRLVWYAVVTITFVGLATLKWLR